MRVAVDTRRAMWARNTGIGRYVAELTDALQAIPDIEVIPLGSSEQSFRRPLLKIGREQLGMVPASRRADLFHATYYESSPLSGRRLVLSVHDLDTVDAPGRYSRRVRTYNNPLLRVLLRRTSRVLVPSLYTRDRVEARYRVGEKVDVTPYGVSERFSHPSSSPLVPGPYLLYTGGITARKNLPVLLDAARRMMDEGYRGRLVLTGKVWQRALPVEPTEALGDRLVVTGVVSEESVAALYAGADLLLYPSELEGFGFPVLEAFAAGCPVICSRSGSLPELAGDAAVQVDHTDAAELARAALALLADDQRRRALIALGRTRAATFTWRRTALQTYQSYERALA